MTYRNDHDAAVARGDALEDELERTKRELEKTKGDRDKLAAEVKELEQYRPEPEPPPPEPKVELALVPVNAKVDHKALMPAYVFVALASLASLIGLLVL